MTAEAPVSVGDEIKSNDAIIEVRVRELSQLFNSMDPSPFLDKDLDVDAEEFIVSWVKDLPDDKPLALLVHLDKCEAGENDIKMLRDSIHSFFQHRAESTQRSLRQLLRRGRTSLFIGLFWVAGSILLGDWVVHVLEGSSWADIFRESLLIGGWVAMWRPLEIFLYDWWPIRNERRVFERLSRCAVRITCTGRRDAESHPTAQPAPFVRPSTGRPA